MSLSQWLFALGYDAVNAAVEDRVRPYREQTAGRAQGEVLEIGAGTGANLPFYPDDVGLAAVEPNPHMARRLRRRASKLGRDVAIVSDVGESLRFHDASFDTVVTTLVLCMVDDLRQVLSEARRVLRAGGSFLFYEHVASRSPGGLRFQQRLNPAWRFLTTGCNLDRDIGGAIEAAGFRRVRITEFDLAIGAITIPNIVGAAIA